MSTKMRYRRYTATLTVLAVSLVLLACSPTQSVRGHLLDEDRIAQIKSGVHDRASIAALLGTPSSIGTFDDKTWYYISQRTEKQAFFQEDVLERKIVAIDFDDGGIVSGVRRYELKDGQEVALVERTTPTRGKELTVLQQLIGNLGRFNPEELN